MRTIHQPGTPVMPRAISLGCRAEKMRLTFMPGKSVLDSVHEALADKGYESAVIEARLGVFQPLVYVTPIIATNGIHAAWYSETHKPEGRANIEDLVMTFGRRDGKPFLHCHGIWQHADGFRGAGHLMPHDARFSEPLEAEVWGLSGAIFDQVDDSETQFRLFSPLPHAIVPVGSSRRAVLCRLKPNELIHEAIEKVAREHGIANASLHGIGSLIGGTFTNGQMMKSAASELMVREGRISPDGKGQPEAILDIAVVDTERTIFEGEIVHGVNTVCITFELLIVEDD